jgi:MYXO-CTERM domain-containing protein
LLELGGDALSDQATDPLATPPTVKPGKATVNGAIDEDIVRRIVRAHISELQACYNEGLSRNPRIGGRLAPQFVISPAGKVSSAVVSESTIRDSKVGVCFAKAFKRWTFPKSSDDKSTIVTYPFELSPWPGFEPSPGSESPGSGLAVPPSEFILTRLHARYDATSLGEDLVFQAAPPITGGREVHGSNGELEQGATVVEGGVDNFQARYAIRHAWTGEIACSDPVHGRWGGPPDGVKPAPTVAKQLTEVARGASLSSFFGPAKVERAPEPALAESEKAPASGCACSSGPDRKVPVASFFLLTLLGLRRTKRRRDHG